ncbi:Glycerophosphocholine phosphodiesterase [Dimargaris cristalligena]|nr:Glycerophosphocholine phosphodiesterase [Dimargaris cristalligena]
MTNCLGSDLQLQPPAFNLRQIRQLTLALQADDCSLLKAALDTFLPPGKGSLAAFNLAVSSSATGQALYLLVEGACAARARRCITWLTQTYPAVYLLHDIHGRTLLHRLCMLNGITDSLDTIFHSMPLRSPRETLSPHNGYFSTFTDDTAHCPIRPTSVHSLSADLSRLDIDQAIRVGTAKLGRGPAPDFSPIVDLFVAHIQSVEAIAQRDIYGRSALHYAAVNGFDVIAKTLLRALHRLDPSLDINSGHWCDQEGCTPLIYAVINNHFGLVQALIDLGQIDNVDATILVPTTPSFPTTSSNSTLNAFGVSSPFTRTDKPIPPETSASVLSTSQSFLLLKSHLNTPLTVAAKLGFTDIIKFLLERGANPNAADKDGETPIHYAAREGHAQVLRLLTQSSCPNNPPALNEQDTQNGWTPLCLAALEGHLECVRILLAAGADPNVLDTAGWNAHERAAFRGHCQVTDVLRPLSRKPIEAIREFRNQALPDAITGPARSSSKSTLNLPRLSSHDSSQNRPSPSHSPGKSFIERTYGHKYLQNQGLLVVTLGSNDEKDTASPLELRDDFFDILGATVTPTSNLALVISADTAVGAPTTLHLPLDRPAAIEPLQFLCSLDRDVHLQFDLVAVEEPGTPHDAATLVGRASVRLPIVSGPSHVLTSAAGCEKLLVSLLSTPHMFDLGSIRLEYIMIHPFSHPKMSLNSRAAYWKSLSTKVIGHRGSGMNRDASGGSNLQVGENTVLSFITAANLGAEYVEFDVQLTSDLTPVIYHDWTVTETGIDVPIHSLTKDQFLALTPRKDKDYNKGHHDPSVRHIGHEAEKQAAIAVDALPKRPQLRATETTPIHSHTFTAPHAPITTIAPATSNGGHASSPLGLLDRLNSSPPISRVSRSNSLHGRPQRSPRQFSIPESNLEPAPITIPPPMMSSRSRPSDLLANSTLDLFHPMPPPISTSISASSYSSARSNVLEDDRLREELNEELEKVLTHKKVPKKVKGNNAETIQAPFTTLAETFRQVPAHVGFNIEVKYPMKCEAQDAAVWSHVELNRFVDSILKVVYDLAGDRDVIFSSFHPDICLMLNVKQPSYPVFFLTDGGYYPYVDARCNSLQEAVRFAKHAGLLGIVSVSTLILQAPILAPAIKNQGLLLFTYGVLNNSVPCVQLQKQLEVDAVIVDSVMAVRKGLQDP